MSLQHILDFVGQHHELKEHNGKLALKTGLYKGGLIYQDFLIHQNLMFLAHGPFLSIVDLNSFVHPDTHQHLTLQAS